VAAAAGAGHHYLLCDKGVWSLNVTRNWRLTFQIKDGEIWDIDYEDYH
jgi:plasmid maintenance system killer protein